MARDEVAPPDHVIARAVAGMSAGSRLTVEMSVRSHFEGRLTSSDLAGVLRSLAWQSNVLRDFYETAERKRPRWADIEQEVLSQADIEALMGNHVSAPAKRCKHVAVDSSPALQAPQHTERDCADRVPDEHMSSARHVAEHCDHRQQSLVRTCEVESSREQGHFSDLVCCDNDDDDLNVDPRLGIELAETTKQLNHMLIVGSFWPSALSAP